MFTALVALFLVVGTVAFLVAGVGLAAAGVTYAVLSVFEYVTPRVRAFRGALALRRELECRLHGACVTIGEDGEVEVTLRFRSDSDAALPEVSSHPDLP